MTISEAIEELETLKAVLKINVGHSGDYMYRKVKAITIGIEALNQRLAAEQPKKVVLDDD